MNFNSLRKEIISNNASVKELINDIFTKIDHKDPEINSYICTTKDNAISQAEKIDKLIQNKEKLPPLAGMPIAIKDNICTKGVATTCASKMLKSFVAPYESTASGKLWSSGGICLGKTNLDEFAMGSSTETSVFGVTSNPWDINRVPGGSSGGSAASVAAGFCAAAIGSDTGGSIRQPASFCGVVGLKPTYGRVSRWGLIAFASSLDQIGPITNTVSDASEILYSISGKDRLDSTCLDKPVPNYLSDINKSIKQNTTAYALINEFQNINKQNILKIVNFIRSNQSPLIRNILDFDQDDILKRNNSKSGALIYENSVLCTILKDINYQNEEIYTLTISRYWDKRFDTILKEFIKRFFEKSPVSYLKTYKENSQLNLFLEECNLKEKNQEIILIRNTIVKNEAKQVNIINQSLESIFEKLSPQGNPYPSPFPLKTK